MPSTPVVENLILCFNDFHDELLSFVHSCDSTEWIKVTVAEGWPVGVTARHVAVAHYPVIDWVQMIVEDNPLPPVTMDTIDQLNAQHAAEHRACSQEEVANLLGTNHAKVMAYLAAVNDQELERQSYLKLFDVDISAAQLFTAVLIEAAMGHLASMKEAVG